MATLTPVKPVTKRYTLASEALQAARNLIKNEKRCWEASSILMGPAQRSAVTFLRYYISEGKEPLNESGNVNDDMGHKETLAMFDRAIKRAKAAEKAKKDKK